MTRTAMVSTFAWSAALVAVVIASRGNISAVSGSESHVRIPLVQAEIRLGDASHLANRASLLRNRNPFRLERVPSRQADSAIAGSELLAGPPTALPQPALAVAGILDGGPMSALIEGVPGRENGLLLSVGDTSHGVHLQAIRNDTIVLVAFDTTWILTLKKTWR